MNELFLPTFTSARWSVTRLGDSLVQVLAENRDANSLFIYAYAVTDAGWAEIRQAVKKWKRRLPGRIVQAYIGTDHGLTDPAALRTMITDGVHINVMLHYEGVYHPKVFWLSGKKHQRLWIGSNNLTQDGLRYNIEFAAYLVSNNIGKDLARWAKEVDQASVPFGEDLIVSYEAERRSFAEKRALSRTGTFTWSKREKAGQNRLGRKGKAKYSREILLGATGDLIVEIMPLETGQDGKQIQLPMRAAAAFFRLPDRIGATREISLKPIGSIAARSLQMTVFRNRTVRLSLSELDYRDRPCLIVFHRMARNRFQFEIVRQSIFPARYRKFLKLCQMKTRQGSRRWTILEADVE